MAVGRHLIVTIGLAALATSCSRPLIRTLKPGNEIDSASTSYCLPKRLLNVVFQRDDSGDTIRLEALPPIADGECFLAELNHSAFANDEAKLAVSPTGVLTGLNTTGEDVTGQVVLKLAEVAVQIAKQFGLIAKKVEKPKKLPQRRELTFDPSDPKQVEVVKTALADVGYTFEAYRADTSPMPATQTQASLPSASTNAMVATTEAGISLPVDGILYRVPLPYLVQVSRTRCDPHSEEACGIVLRTIVSLPNGGQIRVATLRGGPLVKTAYELKLDNGGLTELKATKPSEALAFASLLPDLFKTVAGAATEASPINIKVDYSSKHEDVVTAQKVVIDQQAAKIDEVAKPKAPEPPTTTAPTPP